VVAFAWQRRSAGWYVRLVRYPEPNPAARHLTGAGPYADVAAADAGAADRVYHLMAALDPHARN
jgi:hypothetical protein